MSSLLFNAAPSVSLSRQIRCVEREIVFRERVYARRVADGKMTGKQAAEEIDCMKAVLQTLLGTRP